MLKTRNPVAVVAILFLIVLSLGVMGCDSSGVSSLQPTEDRGDGSTDGTTDDPADDSTDPTDADSTDAADPVDVPIQLTCGDAIEFDRLSSPSGEDLRVVLRLRNVERASSGPSDVSGFPYFYSVSEPEVIDQWAYLSIRKVGWNNGIDHGFTRKEFTDAARSGTPERVLLLPGNGTVTGENNALYRAFQMGIYDFGTNVFGTSNPGNPNSGMYNDLRTNGSNSFIVLKSTQPINAGGCLTVEARLPRSASFPDDWTYISASVRSEESGSIFHDMELMRHESSHDSDAPGSAKMAGIGSGTYEFIFYLSHHDEGGPNVPSAYQSARWFRTGL